MLVSTALVRSSDGEFTSTLTTNQGGGVGHDKNKQQRTTTISTPMLSSLPTETTTMTPSTTMADAAVAKIKDLTCLRHSGPSVAVLKSNDDQRPIATESSSTSSSFIPVVSVTSTVVGTKVLSSSSCTEISEVLSSLPSAEVAAHSAEECATLSSSLEKCSYAKKCLLQQMLQEKIRKLETEVADKDEQLQQERTAAQRALLVEKDANSEFVQALQLRLYISETRLSTLEDALQQHIDSVTNRVASPLSSRHNLHTASSSIETTKTTPLYSRVLSNQVSHSARKGAFGG